MSAKFVDRPTDFVKAFLSVLGKHQRVASLPRSLPDANHYLGGAIETNVGRNDSDHGRLASYKMPRRHIWPVAKFIHHFKNARSGFLGYVSHPVDSSGNCLVGDSARTCNVVDGYFLFSRSCHIKNKSSTIAIGSMNVHGMPIELTPFCDFRQLFRLPGSFVERGISRRLAPCDLPKIDSNVTCVGFSTAS